MATITSTNVTKTAAGPVVTVRATGVSSGDQISIPVGMETGTIVRRDYTLVSGTGTTVTYVTHNRDGSSNNLDLVETWSSAAAAYLTDATKVPFSAPSSSLFTTLTLDDGSDNVVVIRLHLSTRFV